MDRGGGTPPQVNSFYRVEDCPASSPDSGKKRKLQYEHLGLPLPKHKFRDRCSSPAQGSPSPTQTHSGTDEIFEERTNLYGPDPSEGPSMDSSSSIAGDESKGQAKMSPDNLVFLLHEPLSALPLASSRDDSSFRSRLYSLDSRAVKKGDPEELNAALRRRYSDGEEDEIQVEEPECRVYDKFIKECPDASIEELMLYGNDVAPNVLAHPSSGWGFKQDARLRVRKPTIDQEFEQYFSMLML